MRKGGEIEKIDDNIFVYIYYSQMLRILAFYFIYIFNNSIIRFYIFTSFGFYIFTSVVFYILHFYIFTSLHLYIFTSLHLYIFTSLHLYIFTSFAFLNSFVFFIFPFLSFLLWLPLINLNSLLRISNLKILYYKSHELMQ